MGAARALRLFTTRDLVIIAVLASLGIAVKPVVVPLAHLVSAPLLIPAGALAGGIYMMWLVVGMGIVGKRGTATLIALVQALLVMLTGVVGSHGALSLISYTAPGIVMDLGLLLTGHRACCLRCCFLAGILANVTGTLMVSFIFFRLPPIPLALTLCTAALSGGLGGILAWQVIKALRRYHIGVARTGQTTNGSTLLAVAALAAVLVFGATACSSNRGVRDGTAAGDGQGAATREIPIVYGSTATNAVLEIRGRTDGARSADGTALNEALRAAGLDGASSAAVFLADGSVERLPSEACTIAASGAFLVRGEDAGTVTGIVLDPPRASIGDVRRLAQENLAAGGQTLIVYLDGFGYDQYVAAKKAGRISHIARLTARRALTVYPTITPVTFATMVSGEDPSRTGVHDRAVHRVSCETIYDWAAERGMTASLVEGDLQILALTDDTILNIDEDGDGLTDDEEVAAALRHLAEGQPDLMMVHFHGIDDVATSTGPFSAATLRTVRSEDAMVGALMRAWVGQVIVVADHGVHAVDNAAAGESQGHHGGFRSEDLFIPLLVGTTRKGSD